MESINITSLLADPDMGPKYESAMENYNQGKFSEAEEIIRGILHPLDYYEDHWGVVKCKRLLSRILNRQGKANESIQVLNEIWQATEHKLGSKTRTTLIAGINYGGALFNQRRYAESVLVFERITQIIREHAKNIGRDGILPFSPEELFSLNYKKAANLLLLGRHLECLGTFLSLMEKMKEIHGSKHRDIRRLKSSLIVVYFRIEEYAQCSSTCVDLMEECVEVHGESNAKESYYYKQAAAFHSKCLALLEMKKKNQSSSDGHIESTERDELSTILASLRDSGIIEDEICAKN